MLSCRAGCVWCFFVVGVALIGGCATPVGDFNPLQDLLDYHTREKGEEYYREKGYDSERARRAVEEDEMFDWFNEQK
jgi:hypothetical protein